MFSTSFHQDVYTSDSRKFGVPILGNIGSLKSALSLDSISTIEKRFKDLISSDRGLSIGVYPYRYLSTDKHSVLYGIVNAKVNSYEMEDQKNSEILIQGRLGIGYEYGFGKLGDSNKQRWIISLSPILSFFDKEKYFTVFNEKKSSILTIEGSIIYAVTDGIGLMVEANFTEGDFSPLKIGLIYAIEAKVESKKQNNENN